MDRTPQQARRAYAVGLGLTVAAALLLAWANLAVGLIGNEENPANRIYWGVLGVALVGSLLARFRARGMAVALAATAAAQGVVAVVAQMSGDFTWVLTAVFVAVWLGAAWLFRQASAGTAPA